MSTLVLEHPRADSSREGGELLRVIDSHFGYPKPDRRSERWVLCPFHADHRLGSFSYSERGFQCFSCDAKGGLRRLADHLQLADKPLPLKPRRPAPPPTPVAPEWTTDPDYWQRFLPLPRVAREYAHSRGLTDESIERWRIGYGVLPASRCHHPRLVLPIFENGKLVGLRGRALACDCTKWLQSAGSKLVLFGSDTIKTNRTLIVTEAPLSAILAMQEAPSVSAVAICGANIWREEYTQRVKHARPSSVLIWLDCDEAGLTGGVKIVNELLAAGVHAKLYQWPAGTQPKTDLADVACRG